MNNTATFREVIRGRTEPFIAADFVNILPSSLTKMIASGEIVVAGRVYGAQGRRVNVYKVGKLKPKVIEKKKVEPRVVGKVREIPLYAQLWSLVYPDLFRVPDFSGYAQTVRCNGLD